ncbi:MAG: class I SAM-dependent methyltransferase [Chthoniobacterales bacterium]|nr:class I SAM-dependent methyltransferase [Chthoniobacterales bacterium]
MPETDAQTPHPTLTDYYDSESNKAPFLEEIFDRTAVHYDRIDTFGFLGTGRSYRKWVLTRAGLRPGMRLIDVATGTGLLAVAAAEIVGAENLVCVDPSSGMLDMARPKLNATFIKAGAEQLPVADASFDFLTMGYALRHVADLQAAFREYFRVLKPGGKCLLLEVSRPATTLRYKMARLYFRDCVPKICRAITGSPDVQHLMEYYWETIDQCVAPEAILAALRESGFVEVQRTAWVDLFSEYTAVKPPH